MNVEELPTTLSRLASPLSGLTELEATESGERELIIEFMDMSGIMVGLAVELLVEESPLRVLFKPDKVPVKFEVRLRPDKALAPVEDNAPVRAGSMLLPGCIVSVDNGVVIGEAAPDDEALPWQLHLGLGLGLIQVEVGTGPVLVMVVVKGRTFCVE